MTDSNPYVSLLSHLIALGLVRKLSGEHQLEVAHTIVDAMKLEQLSGIDDLSQEQNPLEVSFAKTSFGFILTACPVREVYEIYNYETEQQDYFALRTDRNHRRHLPDC